MQPVHSTPLNSYIKLEPSPFQTVGNSQNNFRFSPWSARRYWYPTFLFPVVLRPIYAPLFHYRPGIKIHHEVRFSSSFAGLASPPSQTARTPLDVYGFPLIIFTVLRMNQFMTFRAYHKSFPSPFAHKEYPLRIAL